MNAIELYEHRDEMVGKHVMLHVPKSSGYLPYISYPDEKDVFVSGFVDVEMLSIDRESEKMIDYPGYTPPKDSTKIVIEFKPLGKIYIEDCYQGSHHSTISLDFEQNEVVPILVSEEEILEEAHRHSMRNRQEVERSRRCACFDCEHDFAAEDVDEWIDDGQTAICPYCGTDAVLAEASGFPLTADFLRKMHNRWF